MKTNKEFGLVLPGGGTKGAYQVGAWKAIQELNIKIKGIAGVSIGALNGALILQDDIKKMEELYENININKIMKLDGKIDTNKSLFDFANIKHVAIDYVKQKGIDNKPLRKLAEENVDIDKIYKSKMDFGLLTYSVKDRKPIKVFKNDIPRGEMIEYLLASACFPVFKAQKIEGNECFDGGLYDNIPINCLIEKGYKNIIVIDIAGVGFSKKVKDKNVYIKVISPSEDLGGTFEFNKKTIRRNMEMGYLDTLRSFSALQGHIYYFKNEEFIKLLEIFGLNTIYGLENAAKIYNIERYKIYSAEEFLKILEEKHKQAEEKYERIRKNLNIKSFWQVRNNANDIFNKGLGLCLVQDFYMDHPATKRLRYLDHYISDYLLSSKAMIELENYLNN